ncbi:hypothetical protein PoB_002672800 [Plakobranchus ocellatus]|uniref:Uncharacterized protein n=1 Tax=Plakobranchus ocellatus TaxID=259542 RepID=A0AAV4A0P2_9GAST|nr:hypothetical protein PoB_002672800 [Plakobranchus ocellatus]
MPRQDRVEGEGERCQNQAACILPSYCQEPSRATRQANQGKSPLEWSGRHDAMWGLDSEYMWRYPVTTTDTAVFTNPSF